jgi:hypothetical protein
LVNLVENRPALAAPTIPMGQTERFKAAIAAAFIEPQEELYRRTGNPIHLWHAYVLARQGGMPIPDWVLAYIDSVARVLTGPTGPNSPKAIADALGLGTKGGPSKARQAGINQRHLDIVNHILVLLDAPAVHRSRDLDLDRFGIMNRVADAHGLSVERVQQIYYEMLMPQNPTHHGRTTPTKTKTRARAAERPARRTRRPRRTNS